MISKRCSNARIQDWNRAHGNLTDSGSTERHFSLCAAFFLVPKHCSRSPLQKGINWTQVEKERMHWVRVRFTIWLYSKQNIQSVRYFKPFFRILHAVYRHDQLIFVKCYCSKISELPGYWFLVNYFVFPRPPRPAKLYASTGCLCVHVRLNLKFTDL